MAIDFDVATPGLDKVKSPRFATVLTMLEHDLQDYRETRSSVVSAIESAHAKIARAEDKVAEYDQIIAETEAAIALYKAQA